MEVHGWSFPDIRLTFQDYSVSRSPSPFTLGFGQGYGTQDLDLGFSQLLLYFYLQNTCLSHNQETAALSNLPFVELLLLKKNFTRKISTHFTQFSCKTSFHSSQVGKSGAGATGSLVFNRGDMPLVN